MDIIPLPLDIKEKKVGAWLQQCYGGVGGGFSCGGLTNWQVAVVQRCTAVTTGRLATEGFLCNFGAATGPSFSGSGSDGEASSLLAVALGAGGSLGCF